MFTFGKTPTYQSDENFQLNISPDQRALTATFSTLEITVGTQKSPAPISSHLFCFVLPLEGDGERVEIEVTAQGFVSTPEGATASIMLSVNGQTSVADFPGNSDQSLLHTVKFAADSSSECRICVFLLLGKDANNCSVEAFMNVSTIDAEILPRGQ